MNFIFSAAPTPIDQRVPHSARRGDGLDQPNLLCKRRSTRRFSCCTRSKTRWSRSSSSKTSTRWTRIKRKHFERHIVFNDPDWDHVSPIIGLDLNTRITPRLGSRESYHFFRHSLAEYRLDEKFGTHCAAIALADKTKVIIKKNLLKFEGDSRTMALPRGFGTFSIEEPGREPNRGVELNGRRRLFSRLFLDLARGIYPIHAEAKRPPAFSAASAALRENSHSFSSLWDGDSGNPLGCA